MRFLKTIAAMLGYLVLCVGGAIAHVGYGVSSWIVLPISSIGSFLIGFYWLSRVL